MSKHEDSIREGAQDLLEPGEEIVAALVVSPRGTGTAMAGGVAAGEIGARWSGKNRKKAENAGLVVKKSSGLALTNQRLLTLELGISMMGGIKEVNELLSDVPLEQVDGMKSKWNVLTIDVGGTEVKLECKPPAAKAMVSAFEAARTTA
jgi:hypothetical protein